MNVLESIQEKSNFAASKIEFKINYLPDLLEEHDLYEAYNKELNIYNCGETPEKAIENARIYASILFFGDSTLLEKALADTFRKS